MNVHYNKLCIPAIHKVMGQNGSLSDDILKEIDEQLNEFINF